MPRGRPKGATVKRRPFKERFWAKVFKPDKPDSCWIWTGGSTEKGYGRVKNGSQVLVGAHRASYELTYGPIPDGMNVLHRCDLPCCVNPEHLFLGTHQDNVDDMFRKGRQKKPTDPACLPRGEEHYRAILTEEDVIKIRKIFDNRTPGTGRIIMREFAEIYHVSYMTIKMMVYRQRWKHLP